MALNRDSRRAAPISKRQPPMEEKKATPKSKVGIRLFNEDVDWHGLVRICMDEMISESGFFLCPSFRRSCNGGWHTKIEALSSRIPTLHR